MHVNKCVAARYLENDESPNCFDIYAITHVQHDF